jgi:hypothetical protein
VGNLRFKYESRTVLFLDLLGFRQKVKDDPKKIYTAIFNLKFILTPQRQERALFDTQFIQFSDCIVIAAKTDSYSSSIGFLALVLSRVSFWIGVHKMPLRGGISFGDHSYVDEILISPAQISAFDLESQFARYPRVLVSDSLIQNMHRLAQGEGKPKAQIERDLNLLTKVDRDGFRFLDYLNGTEFRDERGLAEYSSEARRSILTKHKEMIVTELTNNKVPSVREKFVWLGNYHNKHIEVSPGIDKSWREIVEIDANLFNVGL